jgi:hypothetical protein
LICCSFTSHVLWNTWIQRRSGTRFVALLCFILYHANTHIRAGGWRMARPSNQRIYLCARHGSPLKLPSTKTSLTPSVYQISKHNPLYDLSTYARHPCSALQIEHHPYLTQPGLINMAQSHNIVVTAYSSFGPQSFLELPPDFRQRAADVAQLFDARPVKSVASKHNKTPAQVLLRWATQRNIAVIPKYNN